MDTLVAKVLPLLSGKTVLNVELVTNVVSVLRENLTAEQKSLALQVLQAVVTKWQQETTGVTVPYEVEASFELVVASAFSGDKAAVVANVEVLAVSCWDQFLASLCRAAVADIPAVVQKVEATVDASSSVPESVKKAVDAVVENIAAVVTDAASAAAVSVDADAQKNAVNTAATVPATSVGVAAADVPVAAADVPVAGVPAVGVPVVDAAEPPASAQEQPLQPQPSPVNVVKL